MRVQVKKNHEFFFLKIIIFLLFIPIFILPDVSSQEPIEIEQVIIEEIIVEDTKPCFLQTNTTYYMLKGCGLDKDFLTFSFMGFEWITGGNFTIVITSVFILFTYLKYQNASYPIIIGLVMLPMTYNFFPVEFLSFAFVMLALVLSILGWHIFVRQTKEYP